MMETLPPPDVICSGCSNSIPMTWDEYQVLADGELRPVCVQCRRNEGKRAVSQGKREAVAKAANRLPEGGRPVEWVPGYLDDSTSPEAIATAQRQSVRYALHSLKGIIDVPALCESTILPEWVVRRRLAELGLGDGPVSKARPKRPHAVSNMQAVIDALKKQGGEASTREVAEISGLPYKRAWDYLTGNPRHFSRLPGPPNGRFKTYRWRLRTLGELRPQQKLAPSPFAKKVPT